MSEIKILSWNIGGGKFLRLSQAQRSRYRKGLNENLFHLIEENRPDIIVLQEIVKYGSHLSLDNLIEVPNGYNSHYSIALDSERHTYPQKWQSFRENGGWSIDDYLGLGCGLLWRKDIAHAAIWDSKTSSKSSMLETEKVHLDTGLYSGDRDTEPRLALVAHYLLFEDAIPLDIFVVNLHLTTLKDERQGIHEADVLGKRIRVNQLETVLYGIVSRYNASKKNYGNGTRPPIWILAGDFNCMPDSWEIMNLLKMNYLDLNPDKGTGTKAKGLGGGSHYYT
jgi:endonuclease/exonuclease/phosphatase family metal-dependent hydrolase